MKLTFHRFVIAALSLLGTSGCATSAPYPVVVNPNPFLGSRFYVSTEKAKQTSVLLLHGSGGGSQYITDIEANILATQGFSVLNYCYFDCARGPVAVKQALKNVEITKVLEAIAWLRAQPQSNHKVVVYGFSRGAELALLIGSHDFNITNKPDAIIAHTPSDVTNGPFNQSWRDPACWICKNRSGHCENDYKPSEYFRWKPSADFGWNPVCGPDEPSKMDYSKSAWLDGGLAVPLGERISIEKFDGPVLITVGEKDEVWPIAQTKRIEETLKAAGRKPVIHYFPNGHYVFNGDDEIERRTLVLKFLKQV